MTTYAVVIPSGCFVVVFTLVASSATGRTELVEKLRLFRIQTQNEVLDFPKQAVITRDNAMIFLDAVMNYKVRVQCARVLAVKERSSWVPCVYDEYIEG